LNKLPSQRAAATPDLFHRYLDVRMRAARGLGNGSQFVFVLDGTLHAESLRERLAVVAASLPVVGAGLPAWPARRWESVEGHRVPVREQDVPGSVDDWFGDWFGRPFASMSEPSLEFVVGRSEEGTAVLVRWLHALSDAPGMDLFCRLLDGEPAERFKLEGSPGALVARARGGAPWWRRALDVHRLALGHLVRSVPSPYQPRMDRRAPQTARVQTLSVEETSEVWARSAALGGLDRNAFLVGALARAAVRAWEPATWRTLRIPVPVSLRPPAWRGPVLGNWFTMVLLQVPVRRLRTLEEAVVTCREAWRAALSRGEDRATMTLMGPAAVLPPWAARAFLDGPRLRDGATMNTSFVELQAGASGTWMGLPLRRAAIASSILAPPGVAGVFSAAVGRLSVAVPGQVGAAGDALRRELLSVLRGEET